MDLGGDPNLGYCPNSWNVFFLPFLPSFWLVWSRPFRWRDGQRRELFLCQLQMGTLHSVPVPGNIASMPRTMREPAWKLSKFFAFSLGTSLSDWSQEKNVKVKCVDCATWIKRLGEHNLGKWKNKINLGGWWAPWSSYCPSYSSLSFLLYYPSAKSCFCGSIGSQSFDGISRNGNNCQSWDSNTVFPPK